MKKIDGSKPVSPNEIEENKSDYVYPIILETVNNILAERYNKGKSVAIKLDEIIVPFLNAHPDITRDDAFKRHLFDIEEVYRASGWVVKFESPDRDQSFDSYFEFKKK